MGSKFSGRWKSNVKAWRWDCDLCYLYSCLLDQTSWFSCWRDLEKPEARWGKLLDILRKYVSFLCLLTEKTRVSSPIHQSLPGRWASTRDGGTGGGERRFRSGKSGSHFHMQPTWCLFLKMGLLILNMILCPLTTFRDYSFGGLYRKPLSESTLREQWKRSPSCLTSLPLNCLTMGISNMHKLN